MWNIKRFKTHAEQEGWITSNSSRYQMERLFVNNGYAVQYRRLRRVY
jgi:hypothetical protein